MPIDSLENAGSDGPSVGKHTIYDIARLAGVSGKTVSRVLNNEPSVSPATRDRVSRIIEELGYQPHHGARSMRGQQRDCVGVVFSAPMNKWPVSHQQINWLFFELERIFGARGKFICFDLNPYANSNGIDGVDYARALWQQRCNGCLVHGALQLSDKTILRIHNSGYPYMALNRFDDIPDLCSACVDYDEAAFLSAQRLIRGGHKRIGMLQAFHDTQAGKERRSGYVRALEDAGIEIDDSLVRPVSFASNDVAAATLYLLTECKASAIIDCSMLEDPTSVREGARRAGRVAGKDFEMVDWTYSPDSVVLPEACAHVRLPLREAASEGMELLAQWFDRERDEPFQILRQPVLFEADAVRELPIATPIFDTIR